MPSRTENFQHSLDAGAVLGQRSAAYLHLDDGVATLEITRHLPRQFVNALAGIVVATCGVHEHARIRSALTVALSEQPEQRSVSDLRDRVPYGHVDCPYRDRTLAVATRLLVGHQLCPDTMRVEVLTGVVDKGLRI